MNPTATADRQVERRPPSMSNTLAPTSTDTRCCWGHCSRRKAIGLVLYTTCFPDYTPPYVAAWRLLLLQAERLSRTLPCTRYTVLESRRAVSKLAVLSMSHSWRFMCNYHTVFSPPAMVTSNKMPSGQLRSVTMLNLSRHVPVGYIDSFHWLKRDIS